MLHSGIDDALHVNAVMFTCYDYDPLKFNKLVYKAKMEVVLLYHKVNKGNMYQEIPKGFQNLQIFNCDKLLLLVENTII